MPLTLREFRTDDFETLWSIDQQCFAPGIAYSRRELQAYIQLRSAFTLIAEGENEKPLAGKKHAKSDSSRITSGREILGYLVAHANRRGIGHIITIDVRPDARRQKAGSLLLAAAEERLRKMSCQSVVLETAVDNSAALAFYKCHGYSVVKTVPRYYSNGVDALVLEKVLQESRRQDLLSPSRAG